MNPRPRSPGGVSSGGGLTPSRLVTSAPEAGSRLPQLLREVTWERLDPADGAAVTPRLSAPAGLTLAPRLRGQAQIRAPCPVTRGLVQRKPRARHLPERPSPGLQGSGPDRGAQSAEAFVLSMTLAGGLEMNP